MIDVAPEIVHTKVSSIEEALLYCQFLEVDGMRGWRLPTYQEWIDSYTGRTVEDYHELQHCIISDLPSAQGSTVSIYTLIPVRDI